MYIIASIFVLVYWFPSACCAELFFVVFAAASSFVNRVVLGYVRTCADTYVRVGVSMRACASVHACVIAEIENP